MKLELFKKESCPYCQKVLRCLRESGRTDVALLDIVEREDNRERLLREGGKAQVPCLFMDGKPLYESGDIVAWLEQNPQ
jgi:glutaredoxin